MTVALVVAAAACAYVASKNSNDELHGAYRDSARQVLQSVTASFERDYEYDSGAGRNALEAELRRLLADHPELLSATLYRPGRDTPAAEQGGPYDVGTELGLATEAMSSGEQASTEVSGEGIHAEALVTPLESGGEVVGALALGYDLKPAHELLGERNERVLIVLGLLLTGFAVFAAVLLRRFIFRPVDKLRVATRAVGAGDLGTRLRWRRHDELGDLSRDFDAMAADLQENHRYLEELAHRDPLTGLANHRRFQEIVGKELALSRREDRPLAVVLLDLDDFKRINEAHGHPFGDEVLRAVADSLRSAMRGLGIAGRVGGDEFGIVLPDADRSRAVALAEAARIAVENTAPVRGGLSCSAGIAGFPADAKGAGALLQLADGALRWAKQSGRGRTRPYDPEHVFVVTDEQREDFAALIDRPDAVRPVFQPVVSLASGEPVGFEALARFDGNPGLPPSWWFSQAHRFELGAALEAEALRVALAAGPHPGGHFLAVNLSPSALAAPEVREVLPTDLSGLVIEITEEERVLDVDALQAHLDPLRARGARIAVDDAGEGYAGLQQVMRMRADIIKLDRALVADVHSDPAKIALIGSLVHFARSTGASICAEGVETLDELRVLIHLGVAYAQGWALARPGDGWPRVNAEAARLCRELRSERAKIIPLGAKRRGA
ncbi:MAG TPA: EAL domain-containing protein [Thermoleophilaceae bacterium]|nr:EAL domain-containing protein [Thermoleophilaceae bacterium]